MFGEAKDGKIFNAESPEVIAELAAHPELNLDVAIGNVIMAYEQSLPVEVVLEPVVETPKEEVVAEAAPVAENIESAPIE